FRMIRLFTMFFVYFNAQLTKLAIYFCFTETQCCWTFTLYRDIQDKKSRSTFV
ncbi:hypothetical protein HMPREF3217_00516, partial [Finegoldia magna]